MKHRNGIIQYQKVVEFTQLSKRRIESEISTEAHYRNFDFMIRMVKCYALLWKYGDPQTEVRHYIIEQGMLESLMVLLSDSTSSVTLKYTIAGLLKLFSSEERIRQWFAAGNGIRCILQVLSHFYEESCSEINSISEYRHCISFLYQVLLALSESREFIQSLFHILRFHRVSDLFNLPLIFTKAIRYHQEQDVLKLILK